MNVINVIKKYTSMLKNMAFIYPTSFISESLSHFFWAPWDPSPDTHLYSGTVVQDELLCDANWLVHFGMVRSNTGKNSQITLTHLTTLSTVRDFARLLRIELYHCW